MGANAAAAAAAAVIEDFYLAAHQCTWRGPLPCMEYFASIHSGTIGPQRHKRQEKIPQELQNVYFF